MKTGGRQNADNVRRAELREASSKLHFPFGKGLFDMIDFHE